ncbi:hypothetical protein CMI37_15480 [Candidatus Pacearchaeota archaeon]|nr:hypothetical protein [Candidatus Pacearchaeota archaeon]
MPQLVKRLKPGGSIITNYFYLGEDENNVEHINMDREYVKQLLIFNQVYLVDKVRWVKDATKVNTDSNG